MSHINSAKVVHAVFAKLTVLVFVHPFCAGGLMVRLVSFMSFYDQPIHTEVHEIRPR